MRYSLWNQAASAYDYYEDHRTQDTLNADKPTHIPDQSLGATVDQAGWPLPSDAVKIGQGEKAIGRVVSRKSGVALAGFDPGGSTMFLVAGAVALAYYLTRKRRRS